MHLSTLASVVLFEYSGCDGKQLFDLREAWTLGDAYYGSFTCIDPSLLLFIVTLLCVPLYTVISFYCCHCCFVVVLLYL